MGKSTIDQNGFRRQEANPVSMVGVFPYLGEQIDYDGAMGLEPKKIYWVFRPPEELFSPEALESFNGLPIRVGHIMLGKDFTSVDKEPADGCIYNARQSLDMPEYLIAEFTIYTDKMKEILEKGKIKELSLGYRCQYVPSVGTYKGQPYEFKQVNLRGNHLALVEHGRCGSSVRVCDQALVTFDSLPEEITTMNEEEKKGIEKAQKLAEAVKNGDEQACQDCLDFYDLSPEQRKEALAYVKGKKDAPKATAEDGKAKDGDVPPPPPPPPAEGETPPAGEQPPAPPAEQPPAEGATPAPPPEGGETPPPAEQPATDGCKDKKEKKATKDSGTGVTEPSAQAPKQNLEGAVTPKDDDGKKKEDDKPATTDAAAPKKCADGECKDENGDGKCDKCGCDCTPPAPKTEDENPDAKPTSTPAPETDVPSKMGGEKGEQDIKKGEVVTQDQYQAFVAEYTSAQTLANAIRPYVKETFDSALMREIDVARFAAKNIPSIAFAADASDELCISAVRGFVAATAIAQDSAAKTETKPEEPKAEPPKTEFAMDMGIPKAEVTPPPSPSAVANALSAYLKS